VEIAVVGIYLPVRARRRVGLGVEYDSHASFPIPIAIPTPVETNPMLSALKLAHCFSRIINSQFESIKMKN